MNGTIDNTAIGLGLAVAASGKFVVGAVGATTWMIIEQVVPAQAASGGNLALDARVEARLLF